MRLLSGPPVGASLARQDERFRRVSPNALLVWETQGVKLASGAAGRRPYFGALELELELMLEEWDVIGVYGDDESDLPTDPARRTAQQHEYDDLVRPIIAHLVVSDDQDEFESALVDVLRRDYGISIDAGDDRYDDVRSFARSVIGWWRSR